MDKQPGGNFRRRWYVGLLHPKSKLFAKVAETGSTESWIVDTEEIFAQFAPFIRIMEEVEWTNLTVYHYCCDYTFVKAKNLNPWFMRSHLNELMAAVRNRLKFTRLSRLRSTVKDDSNTIMSFFQEYCIKNCGDSDLPLEVRQNASALFEVVEYVHELARVEIGCEVFEMHKSIELPVESSCLSEADDVRVVRKFIDKWGDPKLKKKKVDGTDQTQMERKLENYEEKKGLVKSQEEISVVYDEVTGLALNDCASDMQAKHLVSRL